MDVIKYHATSDSMEKGFCNGSQFKGTAIKAGNSRKREGDNRSQHPQSGNRKG